VADMASLRQQVARLRGMVQENSHRIDQLKAAKGKGETRTEQKLEKRIARVEAHLGLTPSGAIMTPPSPKTRPSLPAPPRRALSPDEEYKLGLRLFRRGSYLASRRSFQNYLNRKSRGRLAGHAHFWIGETYYKQGQYEEAILSYNQVIKRYRKSPKVPAALLKQGMAFQRMGDRRTARIVLNKLISRFPSSSEARTARRQLRRLR
jgi:tol-pal system protein YbgF